MDARESAVIVAIQLPEALETIRQAAVAVARLGVPAHLTLLYPFVPPDRLRRSDVSRLAAIITTVPEFTMELAAAKAFPARAADPGTTYLAPEPVETFERLTTAIWAAFPEHPPYEGAFDVVIPHLTVADDAGRLPEVAAIAKRVLPIERRVSEAWLIVEGDDGHWARRARLALGRAPRAQGVAGR